MDYLYSMALFAITASVTPGPNNIMLLTSGLNFGIRKSVPLLSGICVGFTVMLLVVGLGFGQIFTLFPQLTLFIKVAGVSYLLYLAWLIARSRSAHNENQYSKPLGFLNGAFFQWVNAKAWVVAIGAISSFTTSGDQYTAQNLTIATTFFLVSFPCVGVWLLFGSFLNQKLNDARYLRWFNLTMAFLLVVSVIPVLKEILNEAVGG
ncbi:LysE family translocator [Vibrio sp.]|uniref:LysE family translocator n=1 Tax=Vibrio viridaestus TaxID=2487322 RepID=A0A3N9U4W1_9VIBR|nr:LysE family translocator [Vibrio viridaestus]MDC0609848.1 LysE family translocator [Vibrio sp.]RQW64722.1 LysE family translocator [Vibrio viridaestus]